MMSALALWLFRKVSQTGRANAVSGPPVARILWGSATKKVSAIPCVRAFNTYSVAASPFAFGLCSLMASECDIAWSGWQEFYAHGQLAR